MLTIVTLGYIATPLSAQTVWDGTADISWYDASQTSFDISTPEQLAGVAQLVNSGSATFNGITLNLTNDIWLNSTGDSTNNWTPIGGSATATGEEQSSGNAFQGVFNAHGHTIYNLYCEKSSYFHAGLFGCIKNPCTIDSLVMVNPVVKSQGMMGAITGMTRSGGSIYIRYCLVINGRLQGGSGNNIGFMVGANYPNTSNTYIQNCGATGTITGNYVGGMGGNSQYETFTNCYFAGSISGSPAGGIAAYSGTINNCYSYVTNQPSSGNGTVVTESEMQSEDMITNLGDAFKMDNGVNNGYPIMSYMSGVDPINAEICAGESITITAFGYDSYVWSNGSTSESITVSPTTTTTYTVTCTSNGVSTVNTSTITVYPQAVVTAEVVASADGQAHGTISPESATVACLSSDNVTFTVTPDANYRVSRVTLNGVAVYGDEFGEGQVTITVNPNGTLGTVKVFLSNEYTISILELQDTGDTLHVPSLVQPYGNNGVFTVTAGSNQMFTFNNTARYALTDAEIDGASQGVISTYEFTDIHENHSIVVTYVDSCGIFGLPFFEDFESVSSGLPECYEKNYGNSSYPQVNSYYTYQGSYAIYTYNYSYGESANEVPCLILPKVADQFSIPELMVQFYGRASSDAGYFVLGVMTDPTDMSTFTAVQTITPTNTSGVYQPYTVYLGNYQGEGQYIAIKMPVTAYCLLGIDNLSVDYAPMCSPVSNLTATDIFGSNVTLTWGPTTVGEVSEYNIYVLDNINETESTYSTSETSYLLTGLNELTSYTVGVFTSCTNGQTSDTTFISFMTPCNSPVNITVGSGSSTTSYFPTYSCYNYSYTQQIIPASAIGTDPMEFSSIFFQCTSVASASRMWDIYVSPVPATSDLSSGWILPSEEIPFQLVKSGNVNISSSGTDNWFEIALDTVLVYNGTDNLLISILDHTGSYSCSNSYKYHSDASTSNMSRYVYRDASTYDPTNPDAAGYSSSNVANIRFTFCDESNCIRPNTLAVGTVDANSAELSWFNPNPTQNCEVEYKADTESEWTSTGTVSGTDYILYGLESNTLYQVRVRAICGSDEESLWSDVVSFRTDCAPITADDLPYLQNFDGNDHYGSGEDAYIFCWNRYTNTPSSPVYYSTSSSAHSLSGMLRFDDGANVVNIAIMPMVEESVSLSELQISFWVKNTSSSSTAVLELGVMTDKDDPTTFETLDTIHPQVVNQYNLIEYSLANYSGNGQYIAFRASNGNGGNNLRLDDVSLDYIPMCLHPVNLTVGDVTSESVTLQWSEEGNASSWVIEYGPAGFNPGEGEGNVETANDTSAIISGLNPNTEYDFYVYSDCGGGLVSTPVTVSTRTECGPIVELPFSENFETGIYSTSQDNYIVCWSRYASDPAHYVYVPSNSYAHSGTHFLDFHHTTNCYNIAIAPELDQSLDVSTLMVNFWACRTGSSGTLEVGVMTDNNDESTFVPVDTIDLSAMNTYAYAEQFVKFNNYQGSGKYIAFRVSFASSCGFYIDDVVIDYAPDCSPVNNVEISDITGTSAMVTWEPGHFGTVDTYTLEYSEGGQESWTTINNITGTSYLLSGLEHSTYYDVRVRPNCDNSASGDWTTVTFHTNCLVGGDFTIGNGTSTNSYLPSYSFYNYSYTQQLFLASEIGSPRSIESVTFDMANFNVTRTYMIYLMHTSATSVSSWIDASSAQLVFNAPQTIHAGLNTFNFPTPFEYNGSDNLLLIVLDMTGSYSSGNTWRTHTAPFTASRYVYQDGSSYSTSTIPSSGTSTSARNNVIFGAGCDTTTTCVAPIISISAVTSDGATVNWVPGYQETSWELEYRPLSDTNWISLGTVTSMSEVISGLTPNTSYMVRMRSDCGSGEYSYWTDATFTTACGAITITAEDPWFEDFDSYTGSGAQQFVCWATPVTEVVDNGISPFVYCGHAPSCHSGSNSAELKGTNNMLVLPEFTNDIHDLRLSFWATTTNTSNYGTVEIGVVTDASDPTTFEVLGLAGTPGPRGGSGSGNGNYMGPFDFNGVTATAGRMAIRFTGYSGLSWNLDDFTVELTPNCPSPVKNSVTASNIDGHNATISFTDNDPDHNSWTVYYREHSAAADDPWMSVVTNTTTVDLNNLTPETTYDVKVVTNCATPDVVEDATNIIQFTTAIACPAPQNVTVTNIGMTTATVSWFSNADSFTIEYGVAGFTPGTGTTATTSATTYDLDNLTAGTSYTVYVTANCGTEGSSSAASANFNTTLCELANQCVYTFNLTDSYGDGWNNGSLAVQQNGITVATITLSSGSSGTETVYLCDNTSTSLVWTAGSFAYEAGFSLLDPDGTEIYTISSMSDYSTYTFTTDCGSTPVITDPTVTTTTASNIGQTNATLNGTITNPDNVTITAKGFEWKATAGGTYTPVTVTGGTLTYSLNNLTANTGYTFKAFITFNGTTVYGEEMTFTTLPEDTPEPCDVPTNLHTTDIQNEAISIAWDADANVTSWNIQYRPVGGTLATATTNTNSYTITGLTGLTTYEIQVQANCGDGNLSDWTAAITPQTTNVGIENYLSNSVILFPNPAKEVINIQCAMYNVQSVEVIDVYGKVINTLNVTENPTRINVSGLANGMYFVRVTTEMGVVTKQFVKR